METSLQDKVILTVSSGNAFVRCAVASRLLHNYRRLKVRVQSPCKTPCLTLVKGVGFQDPPSSLKCQSMTVVEGHSLHVYCKSNSLTLTRHISEDPE